MKLKVFSPRKNLLDDIPNLLDDVELPVEEKLLYSPELQKLIASEVAKAVAAIKLPQPKEPLPQIIKETRVEVPAKDTRKLVEQSALDAALKKIAELEKQLERTDEIARTPSFVPGGAGVIGIPDPGQATVGHVLTVANTSEGKKARFAASSGGGVSLSGYTVTNHSEDKSFDTQNTSLDELARVVGSIITDLSA